MKLYFKLIIEKFRTAIILRYVPKLKKEIIENLGETDFKFLEDMIKADKDGLIRSGALAILLKEYQNMDNTFIAELPLELALIKIINQEK